MKMMFDELVRKEQKVDKLQDKVARLEKELAKAKKTEEKPTFRKPKSEVKRKPMVERTRTVKVVEQSLRRLILLNQKRF